LHTSTCGFWPCYLSNAWRVFQWLNDGFWDDVQIVLTAPPSSGNKCVQGPLVWCRQSFIYFFLLFSFSSIISIPDPLSFQSILLVCFFFIFGPCFFSFLISSSFNFFYLLDLLFVLLIVNYFISYYFKIKFFLWFHPWIFFLLYLILILLIVIFFYFNKFFKLFFFPVSFANIKLAGKWASSMILDTEFHRLWVYEINPNLEDSFGFAWFFFVLLRMYFFNFIFQHLFNWRLGTIIFIICFL